MIHHRSTARSASRFSFATAVRSSVLVVLVTLGSMAAAGCERGEPVAAPAHDHSSHASPAGAKTDPAETFYTCPMHPSVRSPTPGACPICGMNLVAVTAGAEGAEVALTPERIQRIGVKTETVRIAPLVGEIRTVGRITYDESKLADVTLKYGGYVATLHADATGRHVRRGDLLFTLYSPELFAAQQELLTAIASRRGVVDRDAAHRTDYLVDAARARLRLWDLSDAQISEIVARGAPLRDMPILAKTEGTIVEKNVVAGSAVEAGAQLFRIADLSRVWIEADVYESDWGLIGVGDPARIVLPHLGNREIHAEVTFVYPWLDAATRTGRVRLETENPGTELRPDMYVDAFFSVDHGEALTVPEKAVLYAGDARYVFVEVGDGRFRPRAVALGARGGARIEVREGLMPGERIVTSGNFLIAAESRLKVAIEDWR